MPDLIPILVNVALVVATWLLVSQTKKLVKATQKGMSDQSDADHRLLSLQRKETSSRLLLHLIDRWDSATMDWDRGELAVAARDERFVGRRFDSPGFVVPEQILNFFETVGGLVRHGSLEAEMAWNVWGYCCPRWWKECEGYVSYWRDMDQPTAWQDFEYLKNEMVRLESERSQTPRAQVEARLADPGNQGRFLKEEMQARPPTPPPGRMAAPTRRPPLETH